MYGNITTGRLTLPIRRRKRQKGINVLPIQKNTNLFGINPKINYQYKGNNRIHDQATNINPTNKKVE